MKRIAPFFVVFALVIVLAPSANAGAPVTSELAVNPNPATTADDITIGNAEGSANTCQSGEVLFEVDAVDDTDDEPAAIEFVEPDENGDWSFTIDPLAAGDYVVSADCRELIEESVNLPTRFPFFSYENVELTVTQADTSSSSSSTTAAPSTSAAAAAATRPTFTG
jgi:hypothetical protein